MGEHQPPRTTQRRSVWAEHLAPRELCDSALLQLLARYDVELLAAVRPGGLGGVTPLVHATRRHGVRLSLWPMLDDDDGRWLSATNAPQFYAFAVRLCGVLAKLPSPRPSVVLDLEPPIARLRRILSRPWRVLRRPARMGPEPVATIVAAFADADLETWAAVVPMVAADPAPGGPFGAGGWQRLLETSVDPHPFTRVNSMLYSTLTQGYSRGLFAREDARALLFEGARAAARRWGPRVAASVGAVGPGALGDEDVYEGPGQLADDVGLVRAAGIDDISLFELAGILGRQSVDPWFDALCATPAATAVPRRSRRVLVAVAAALAIGRVGRR